MADNTATGVFNHLKCLEGEELAESHVSQEVKHMSQMEHGMQWHWDQNIWAIQSMFGVLPEPSESGDADSVVFMEGSKETLVRDLELQ